VQLITAQLLANLQNAHAESLAQNIFCFFVVRPPHTRRRKKELKRVLFLRVVHLPLSKLLQLSHALLVVAALTIQGQNHKHLTQNTRQSIAQRRTWRSPALS
jgi:hypothetical protein